jgi:predicted nucleic acid-binding protein
MVFKRALIDTNICLDVMQKREPFYIQAAKILEASEKSLFKGFVAAHSFDTLHYILGKKHKKKAVYDAINGLRKTVNVASVTERIIDEALLLEWADFEDSIHYLAAIHTNCEAIVTRDASGFQNPDIQILSPFEFLDQLEN